MSFYSARTSPRRLKLRAPFGFLTDPTTPRTCEDANSNLDEFEFETSSRFNPSELEIETNQKDENLFDDQQEQKQKVCGDSLPTMAFADELFCDGKVLPLTSPLKLPPRLLQNGDGKIMSPQSSTVTSPRSPGLVLFRLPFSGHCLWNDDFDPFMVAMDKVKEEKRGKPKTKDGLRRTRSLSPMRGFNYKSDKHVGLSQSHQHESHCCDPLKRASGRTNMLSEPKGLVFAREVRMGNHATFEPKRTSVSKLAVETKKEESKRGVFGFWTRNKKRENINKVHSGNANIGKASAQHKLEDQKASLRKPALLRKLDVKSVTSTQWDKDETRSDMTKTRLVSHKPFKTLFSLLGL